MKTRFNTGDKVWCFEDNIRLYGDTAILHGTVQEIHVTPTKESYLIKTDTDGSIWCSNVSSTMNEANIVLIKRKLKKHEDNLKHLKKEIKEEEANITWFKNTIKELENDL